MGLHPDTHLDTVTAADQVVVTDHAMEKDVDPETVRDTVKRLAGSIYLDTGTGRYHLVTQEYVHVIAVKDGARVVVTVYPNTDPAKYQKDSFTLLRG